jgi:MoaA/NifB/PqqE/SkfB family radical SAM enzyme
MQSSNQYIDLKQQALTSFHNFTDGGHLPQWALEIFLEISNVCDLKCAMCGVFSALDQNRFIHLKEEERGFFNGKHTSLEKLLEHALLVHCFGYGEPTIYPQFKEVIEYLSQYNVLIDFFTNGMHLTEEMCEFLVEKKVFRIYVSFSGTTKEDYENIYLGGNYETVLSNIKRLAQTKEKYQSIYPQIEINSLAFQHHIDNIVNFIDLMADHGANYISLKPVETSDTIPQLNPHIALMRPWKEGELLKQAKLKALERNIHFDASHFINVMSVHSAEDFKIQHQQLTKQEAIIPISELKNLSKTLKPISARNENIKESPILKENKIEGYLGLRSPEITLEQPCFEPFKTFYVKRDGKVKPCCFSNKFENRFVTLGDINQNPAEEIWQGLAFQTIQNSILEGKYPMNICNHCIKGQWGPQHHGISGIADAYQTWLKDVFQITLDESLLEKIKHLPTNQKILTNRSTEKPLNKGKIISIKNTQVSETFYGFNIDLPSLNSNISYEEIEIHGWVLGKNVPVVKIEVVSDDHYEENTLLGTTLLTEVRTDVADAFPNESDALQCGFIIKVNIENLSPIAYLKVIAVLENNEKHLLSVIGVQHPQQIVGKLLDISLQSSDLLCGFNVDLPLLQTKITDYDLEISGWALGRVSPIKAIEFREQANQQIFKSVNLCFSRPDVEEIYPAMALAEKSGFSAIINLLLLEPKTTIEVVAALDNGLKIPFATLKVQRLPFRTAYQPQIKPLFINSLGRSGTTWFMHLLAQHPMIATHKYYPYELPVMEYYLHNLFVRNLLAMPPEQVPFPELDVNDLFVLNRYRMYNIQQDLLREWFRKQQIEGLVYFCQEQIDKYIEQILNFQKRIGEGLENPLYFAEKLINPSRDTEYLSRLIWELYPQGKEIILVRDFRDMFCSVLSFMKKRDLKICFGLDFQHAHTEEEYVEITKQRIDFIWNCWETRKYKAYLVRYEDLIEKPLPILKGIFEYLNVDHDEATLQMILQKASKRNAEMTDHITSSTVDASLGRWKKDLSPELQRLCNEAFKPALEAFGYSVENY